jgi:hypothetical protein
LRRFPTSRPTTKVVPSEMTSWSCGAPSGARAVDRGWECLHRGRSFVVPFANVTPFRDGLMEGESIYFDLATLCEQAALPLDEVRAAASKRAAALRSATGN